MAIYRYYIERGQLTVEQSDAIIYFMHRLPTVYDAEVDAEGAAVPNHRVFLRFEMHSASGYNANVDSAGNALVHADADTLAGMVRRWKMEVAISTMECSDDSPDVERPNFDDMSMEQVEELHREWFGSVPQ